MKPPNWSCHAFDNTFYFPSNVSVLLTTFAVFSYTLVPCRKLGLRCIFFQNRLVCFRACICGTDFVCEKCDKESAFANANGVWCIGNAFLGCASVQSGALIPPLFHLH